MNTYPTQTMTPDHQPAHTEAPVTTAITKRRDDRLPTRETVFLLSSLLTLAGVIVFIGLF